MRGISILLLWTLTACGPPGGSDGPAPSAPEPEAAAGFALYGLPGPWWREGADRGDFERDTRGCRRRSREARAHASPGERSDAAYRAFLDCMEGRDWTRSGPAGASETG